MLVVGTDVTAKTPSQTSPRPGPAPAPRASPLARVLDDPDLVDALVAVLDAPELRALRATGRALRAAVAPRLQAAVDAANAEWRDPLLQPLLKRVAQHIGHGLAPSHPLTHVRMSLRRALADDVSGRVLVRFFRAEMQACRASRPVSQTKFNGEQGERWSQFTRDVIACNVVRSIGHKLVYGADRRALTAALHASNAKAREIVSYVTMCTNVCGYERVYAALGFWPRHAPTTEKQMISLIDAYEVFCAKHFALRGWAPPPLDLAALFPRMPQLASRHTLNTVFGI